MSTTWNDILDLGDRAVPDTAPPPAAEEEAPKKMGAFRRLRESLSKSRRALTEEIGSSLFDRIDDETWDFVFDVNLRALFHMTAAACLHMRERRQGRIVSIASIDAYIPYAKNAHYAASKAAVISFTKSFAEEMAPYDVLVNAVSPGPIDTPNLRALGIYEDLARSTPLGRVADPTDIAEVVHFLADPRNRYMTGETVIASGGIVMA